MGHNGDIRDSFFNKVFFLILQGTKEEHFNEITDADIDAVKTNKTAYLSHVAALNPTGEALNFLKSINFEINKAFNKQSFAHFAAVCNTEASLNFCLENKIDLHAEDDKKNTPLMWAISAKKPVLSLDLLLQNLNKS